MRWDYNAQLARMWQGYEPTSALFHLPFTHEDHRAIPLVQSFYVALGLIGRVVPFDLPVIFHAARFALTLALVLVLWEFSGLFFEDNIGRWLGVVFATVISGWSWILLALAPELTAAVSPIEFWLIDAFNLQSALYMPHFTAAIILQMMAVMICGAWARQPSIVRLGALTLVLAALSLIQPYVVPLIFALLGGLTLHALVEKRLALRHALWLALPLGLHGCLSLYQYLAMRSDPTWSDFVTQNQTLSPHPVYYLTGYLPLLFPVMLGVLGSQRCYSDRRFFVVALWVIAVIALLYLPLPTQRRYLMGVQTPLAILAAQGWVCGVLPRFAHHRRPLVTIVYVTFGSIALILLIAGSVATATPSKSPALYLSPGAQSALDWLEESAGRDELVLTVTSDSEPASGGLLASAAGQRVYIGHWIETARFDDKLDAVERFYTIDTPETWRRAFLETTRIRLIWHDAYARALGAWDPAAAPYLVRVFASEDVTIYRVDRHALASVE